MKKKWVFLVIIITTFVMIISITGCTSRNQVLGGTQMQNVVMDWHIGTTDHEEYMEVNDYKIITLTDDIKVFGLSHKETGIPVNEMWGDPFNRVVRHVRQRKLPTTNFGITINTGTIDFDYIVATEVLTVEGQLNPFTTFTIPAGRYIQNNFNAEDINILLNEKIQSRWDDMRNYAALNNIQIDDSIFVEVYPYNLFSMRYQEMYFLCRIKEN